MLPRGEELSETCEPRGIQMIEWIDGALVGVYGVVVWASWWMKDRCCWRKLSCHSNRGCLEGCVEGCMCWMWVVSGVFKEYY